MGRDQPWNESEFIDITTHSRMFLKSSRPTLFKWVWSLKYTDLSIPCLIESRHQSLAQLWCLGLARLKLTSYSWYLGRNLGFLLALGIICPVTTHLVLGLATMSFTKDCIFSDTTAPSKTSKSLPPKCKTNMEALIFSISCCASFINPPLMANILKPLSSQKSPSLEWCESVTTTASEWSTSFVSIVFPFWKWGK